MRVLNMSCGVWLSLLVCIIRHLQTQLNRDKARAYFAKLSNSREGARHMADKALESQAAGACVRCKRAFIQSCKRACVCDGCQGVRGLVRVRVLGPRTCACLCAGC